jgi:hypothetical protein
MGVSPYWNFVLVVEDLGLWAVGLKERDVRDGGGARNGNARGLGIADWVCPPVWGAGRLLQVGMAAGDPGSG